MKASVKLFNFEKGKEYRSVHFTGHRPDKLPNKETGYDRDNPMRKYIRDYTKWICKNLYYKNNTRRFMFGGALGYDQDAFDAVEEFIYEEGLVDVRLTVAVPFPNQAFKWPKESINYYYSQLEKADKVIYVSKDIASSHNAAKLLNDRNIYMVKNCDLTVALWQGGPGGTKNCIDSAKEANNAIFMFSVYK